MKQKTTFLFSLTLLIGTTFAQIDIPQSSRIRIDGNLNDWRHAKWTPLNTVIDGAPTNISNAIWSLAWDEDAIVYLAVQFDDADIVLKDQTNIADCVEIYARGDTGSQPEDYFSTQSSAQCYTFGMAKNRIDQKIKLGNLTKLPIHVPVKGSVKLEGNHFIYEIMVPLFDTFNPATRRKSSESEVYVGDDIGIDIAIIDVGKNGYAGMLGENDQDKRISASHIAEHTLDD